jgi:hypothetical protein
MSHISAFEYNITINEYIIDDPKEGLETVPGFDSDHWPSMSDEKWNRDVYKSYGRSPYWE